ncbi:MAG: histidine kinase [Pseudoxanthomonas suwonensis]|nr:MAG: histidine kinase [Pseudoxanthomonas suwonensis]
MLNRWRLLALALLVAALIVVPYLAERRQMALRSAAAERVLHSREVETRALEALAELRNAESAAMAKSLGGTAPLLDARLQRSLPAAYAALDSLQQLTRDNPDQQRRLGRLLENVDRRASDLRALTQADLADAPAIVREMTRDAPIEPLAREIIDTERQLLLTRQKQEVAISHTAELVNRASLAIQLLLLALLTWLIGRGMQRQAVAQSLAQRSQARAGVVLNSVREPIVVLDRNLHVLQHNAAFAELYGADGAADINGQPLTAIGNGAWRNEEVQRRLGDVANRSRELWDFPVDQHSSDGVSRTMLLNATRMPLPDSDDVAVLLTASDVSAQNAARREILELNRQLQGKVDQVSDVNRELEAFSYSVSHDLRAPLRHIGGFADKLGRHLGDVQDEKTARYLQVIGDSARRMSQLIDDLLVYSRLGRSAMRLQPVDMQSIVAEKRALLQANAEADNPGHRIQWEIAPLPVVVGDENMLRQVWLNLLGNAVKYSSRSEPAVIRVQSQRLDDGGYRFEVSDNGVGFDMAYADKLFGVFQRLHGAGEFEGTGIGLASVRRVIVRHGGDIGARSAPDEGATFWFTLPPSAFMQPATDSLP